MSVQAQQCSSSAAVQQIRIGAWSPMPFCVGIGGHKRIPARTPTVHWDLDSRKAVGGPFGSDSRYTANIFPFSFFFFLYSFFFSVSSFSFFFPFSFLSFFFLSSFSLSSFFSFFLFSIFLMFSLFYFYFGSSRLSNKGGS